MTQRQFTRALTGDLIAVLLILIFFVTASYAVSAVGPQLPGGPGVWMGAAIGCVVIAVFVMGLCVASSVADERIAQALEPRPPVPGDLFGAQVDAVVFDWPGEGAQVVELASRRRDRVSSESKDGSFGSAVRGVASPTGRVSASNPRRHARPDEVRALFESGFYGSDGWDR